MFQIFKKYFPCSFTPMTPQRKLEKQKFYYFWKFQLLATFATSDKLFRKNSFSTAWKVSVFGVFLIRISPHLDWILNSVLMWENTDQKNFEYGNYLRSTELGFLQISKFRELCHAEEESYIYQLLIRYTNLRQYFFQNYICMFYIYRSEQSSNSAMVVFSSSFSRSFFS